MYAFLNMNDDCVFRRCISEQTRVEGARVIEKSFGGTEKQRAANTTPLSYRHNGERKDAQEKQARDAPHAEGWRREETDDKKQRRDQDSWSRPRRYDKHIDSCIFLVFHERNNCCACIYMFLRVTLIRTNGESLGIGVIGGRGMGRRLRNGEMRRGIFIKHVSENSPAARNNTLTPGDQILQVCTGVNQEHWHPLLVLQSTENIQSLLRNTTLALQYILNELL